MKVIEVDIKNDSILNPGIDRRTEVFKWGLTSKDNQYPSIVEHLSKESVTAKRCINKVLAAIIGKGFTDGETVVHPDGTTLNELGRQLGRELAKQNNCFIHVGFNVDYKPSKLKHISSKRVRIGKSDDENYSGKFCVADWESKRISKEDIKAIDRFNLSPKVVEAQVSKAGGIEKYKGQILHLSVDSSYKYAPSDMHSVFEDCEFEKLSKSFRRNNARYGFLNSKIAIVGKMSAEEERSFKSDLRGLQGGENASNMLVYQASTAGADVEKQVTIKDFSSKLDDKILAYSDSTAESNICKAFSVPVPLVSSKSEGIFGNSGEMLRQMKIQLYEEKEFERMMLEEAIGKILKNGDFTIKDASIIDPFNTDDQ